MEGVIYGIYHPKVRELRYIGKTVQSISVRLARHIRGAKQNGTMLQRWLNQLSSSPMIFIIEENPDNLEEAEKFWIAKARADGVRLLNGTEGGNGGALVGEALEKMKASKTGKPRSEATKKKISENSWMRTPEGKALRSKISQATWDNYTPEDRAARVAKILPHLRAIERVGKKCESGCSCNRHKVPKCVSSCKCGRHQSHGSKRKSKSSED